MRRYDSIKSFINIKKTHTRDSCGKKRKTKQFNSDETPISVISRNNPLLQLIGSCNITNL